MRCSSCGQALEKNNEVPGLKILGNVIIRNELKLRLPPAEIEILRCLSDSYPSAAPKEMVQRWLYASWDTIDQDALIKVYICRLRKRLMTNLGLRMGIYTYWGYGYAILVDEDFDKARENGKTYKRVLSASPEYSLATPEPNSAPINRSYYIEDGTALPDKNGNTYRPARTVRFS